MPAGLLQVHQGQVGPVDPDPGPAPLPAGASEAARALVDMTHWLQTGGIVLGGVITAVALAMFWRYRKPAVSRLVGILATATATAVTVIVAGLAATASPPAPVAAWSHPAIYDADRADGMQALLHVADTFPAPPGPRPFLHRQHTSVSCQNCHPSADDHGLATVFSAQDCAACHHGPASTYECLSCHAQDVLQIPRAISTPMSLTVWDEPRSRELGFEHGLHESVPCQECHTGGVFLAVERNCAACHEDHHRAEADCTSCHLPAADEAHGLEVHLTCTSSGCHAGTAGERPTLTRSLCLTCHADLRDHEPGLSCQECHMVPEQPPVRAQVMGSRGAR